MKREFASKIESNKEKIHNMRAEINSQKLVLIDSKMSYVEVITEFEETENTTKESSTEVTELETQLNNHKLTQERLVSSKKKLEEELYELRDLNSNDICEINKLKYELDMGGKEREQQFIEEESIEQQITVQIGKIESMNKKLESKIQELDDKAYKLEECESEIRQYEEQVDSFNAELEHLQNMEQRYRQENEELHYRIQEENQKNMELMKQINTVETKVNKLESRLTFLKQKSDAKANSQNAQLEENRKLETEIESL